MHRMDTPWTPRHQPRRARAAAGRGRRAVGPGRPADELPGRGHPALWVPHPRAAPPHDAPRAGDPGLDRRVRSVLMFATAVAARAAGLVPGARRGPPCRLIPDPRDRGAREGGPRDCGAPGRALRRRHVLRRARLAGLLRVPATLQDPAALPRLCGRVRDSGSTAMAGPQR